MLRAETAGSNTASSCASSDTSLRRAVHTRKRIVREGRVQDCEARGAAPAHHTPKCGEQSIGAVGSDTQPSKALDFMPERQDAVAQDKALERLGNAAAAHKQYSEDARCA